ncbi:MAG: serine protease [Ferruginibacter sp.]|nr:trypsin-like peptidase domain-containing protein [Ferruginibacter sp.]
MEDTLLMDAAERFIRGEMSAEEKIYFDDLRKNNQELDQTVVEQIFFLNQLNTYSTSKNFKTILCEVESKLIAEKVISKTIATPNGKIITLWKKYKNDIAVAASIAGIVSLFITTIISSVNKTQNNLEPLVKKLNAQADKTRKIETKLNQLQAGTSISLKQPLDARFRATGFMIDATNNYVATNAHVVKEASNHLIVENTKGEQFVATPVYINVAQDLAIIKIVDTAFKKLPLMPYTIRKTVADLGESIFMMGYPKQEIVYGEGYVSAKNGYQMDTLFYQINTTANEGNSGSPILTKNGDLIGIITSKEIDANGVVFAIKSANIYSAIEEIKKDEKIKIQSSPALKGLDRVTQIKKLQQYVFMIKGN